MAFQYSFQQKFCSQKYLTFKDERKQVLTSFGLILLVSTVEFFTNYTEMPIVAFLSSLHEKKKSSDKMLPSVGIEPRPLIVSDSKSNTETLGSLYSHALRIPLKSSKSKY